MTTAIADEIVTVLNQCLEMNHDAIKELVTEKRVTVDESFADHPNIQVKKGEDGDYILSVLGFLNAFIPDEKFLVALTYRDENNNITEITQFQIMDKNQFTYGFTEEED